VFTVNSALCSTPPCLIVEASCISPIPGPCTTLIFTTRRIRRRISSSALLAARPILDNEACLLASLKPVMRLRMFSKSREEQCKGSNNSQACVDKRPMKVPESARTLTRCCPAVQKSKSLAPNLETNLNSIVYSHRCCPEELAPRES
jgi:hypothetical protein